MPFSPSTNNQRLNSIPSHEIDTAFNVEEGTPAHKNEETPKPITREEKNLSAYHDESLTENEDVKDSTEFDVKSQRQNVLMKHCNPSTDT